MRWSIIHEKIYDFLSSSHTLFVLCRVWESPVSSVPCSFVLMFLFTVLMSHTWCVSWIVRKTNETVCPDSWNEYNNKWRTVTRTPSMVNLEVKCLLFNVWNGSTIHRLDPEPRSVGSRSPVKRSGVCWHGAMWYHSYSSPTVTSLFLSLVSLLWNVPSNRI